MLSNRAWLTATCWIFVCSLLSLGDFSTALAAPDLGDGLTFQEEKERTSDIVDGLPKAFVLRGRVVDTTGTPVVNATVSVKETKKSVSTDATGNFSLPGKISGSAQIDVTHADIVGQSFAASRLYSGEGGRSLLVVARYSAQFEATPKGGLLRYNGLQLQLPEGAIDKPVTIRVALLPPDLAYDASDDIQMQRVAAVALSPEGLKFKKPVTLRVPNNYISQAEEVAPLLFDEKTGRYAAAAGTKAQRDGSHTIFSLSHFSRYAAGSPSDGMQRRLMRITSDLNGDGGITTQDAELVVILSGGTHAAKWTQSTGSSAAVMRTTGTSQSSSTTDTIGASGGVSFGGVGVNVSGEVSDTEAQEAASNVGSGTSSGSSQTLEMSLETPEYETDCVYFLRTYEYWRVRKWSKHTPSDGEMPGIQQAYDGRAEPQEEWGYFNIGGATNIALGRTLYGGNKIAVRKVGNTYEVYVMVAEYMVRVPKGGRTVDCDVGAPNEKAADGGSPRFFGGASDMGSSAYANGTTTRYLGWGVLEDTRPETYNRFECRRETFGEITITTETEESSGESASTSSSSSSSTSASVNVEVPFTGGSVGGGVSASSSREVSRSRSSSYEKKFTNQVSTTVRWEIQDPHKPQLVHFSDHELYKLHLKLETRSWRLASDSEIPQSVQDAAAGDGRTFVGTSGGGMVMKDSDNSYYISGPPVIKTKEIGFMLVRVREYPCPGTPTTTPNPGTDPTGPTTTRPLDKGGSPTAGPTEPTPPNRGKPVITPNPHSKTDKDDTDGDTSGTQPTGPGGRGEYVTPKPEITPTPEEYRRQREEAGEQTTVYRPAGNFSNYTPVTFTALDQQTVVNRDYVGDLQSITVVSVDGKRMQDKEKQVALESDPKRIKLSLQDATNIGSIILGGSKGAVEIFRAPRTTPKPIVQGPQTGVSPSSGPINKAPEVPGWTPNDLPPTDFTRVEVPQIGDGTLENRGGNVSETVHVPDTFTDPAQPPASHKVEINNTPVETVAVRENEIAVKGSGVPLPVSGSNSIQVTSPDGQVVQGQADGWGFQAYVQPVTHVGENVTVQIQIQGVPPEEVVRIELFPALAQTVSPTDISIPAGQAAQPTPIAQLTSEVPGTQVLNIRVTRPNQGNADTTTAPAPGVDPATGQPVVPVPDQ